MMKSCWTLAGLALWLALASPLQAQPDLARRIGSTVADTGTPSYRFDDLRVASADGQRHYRVRLAIPKAAAPKAGYPVVYLLDGNAALMELDAPTLESLAGSGTPPVLALLAYDNDLRIDAAGRAFDYTPALRSDGAAETDEVSPDRRSGGADAFLALIEGVIKPQLQQRLPIDPAQQTLWGHSYGGLFVLHALFTRPQAFARYVAVDPSLWWGEGYIVKEADGFVAAAKAPVEARLLLMVGKGGNPDHAPPGRAADQVRQRRAARTAMPADAASALVARLKTRLDAQYRELPGLSHGQTLGASLVPALAFSQQR
jgi:uncharacterized protein